MKKIFFRDPVDAIVFLIALFVFVYCFLITKYNATGGYLAVAGYVFYVMYRFAVLYANIDKYVTTKEGRRFFKLKPK